MLEFQCERRFLFDLDCDLISFDLKNDFHIESLNWNTVCDMRITRLRKNFEIVEEYFWFPAWVTSDVNLSRKWFQFTANFHFNGQSFECYLIEEPWIHLLIWVSG